MRSLSEIIGTLLLAATFLGGCAPTLSLTERAEVQSRRPPRVTLGPELALLNEPTKINERDPLVFLTSLISKDGRVHVFVTDSKKQLHHIEVLADAVVKTEFVGTIDLESFSPGQYRDVAFDAVEQPAGKLRVLVGDKQFVRSAPNSGWLEIRGNRCRRFLPLKGDLYCVFVIKGEELEAPQRTDYTVGWFLVVPWISWSTKQAEKLVVAQESVSEGSNLSWTIRAVVDPETPEDAARSFMADVDDQGTFHFLYFATRGGEVFYVGPVAPAPLIVPLQIQKGSAFLRYAQVALDRQPSSESLSQKPNPEKTSKHWLSVQGTTVQWPEDTERGNLISECVRGALYVRFGANFIIAPAALSSQGRSADFTPVRTPADIAVVCKYSHAMGLITMVSTGSGTESHLWEVRIREGHVLPHLNVVATDGLPESTHYWFLSGFNPIKADNTGNFHALLAHVRFIRFSSSSVFVDYVVKSEGNWSAPLTLGTLYGPRTLAVADTGDAFAAWLNTDRKFVGRWIRQVHNTLP